MDNYPIDLQKAEKLSKGLPAQAFFKRNKRKSLIVMKASPFFFVGMLLFVYFFVSPDRYQDYPYQYGLIASLLILCPVAVFLMVYKMYKDQTAYLMLTKEELKAHKRDLPIAWEKIDRFQVAKNTEKPNGLSLSVWLHEKPREVNAPPSKDGGLVKD